MPVINVKITYYKNPTTKTPYDIRRLRLPATATWNDFLEQVKLQQPSLDFENEIIQFQYQDEENDYIQFSTQEEWDIALYTLNVRKQQQSNTLLRITVTSKGRKAQYVPNNKENKAQVLKRHYGIICDGCNKQNFTGLRYKCQDCPDWDFCEKCFNSSDIRKKHAFNHMFTKMEAPAPRHCFNSQPRHFGVCCDGCGAYNFTGDRHKCQNCPDYDLCDKCYQNGAIRLQHFEGGHSFNKIASSGCPFLARQAQQEQNVVSPKPEPSTGLVDDLVHAIEKAVEQNDAQPEEKPVEQKPEEMSAPVSDLRPPVLGSWPQYTIPASTKVDPHATELDQLSCMGFTDSVRNKELLIKYKGDVAAVVQALLEA